MKNLKEYLNEGLLSRKVSTKTPIRYRPKTNLELKEIIIDLLKNGQTNLNCIDITKIDEYDNLSNLFSKINEQIPVRNIDISEWNLINVKNVENMFQGCIELDCDLSNWNVSNITNMKHMFRNCKSFNSDLSKWDVSSDTNTNGMFNGCNELIQNNNIPKWYKGRV